MKAYVVTTRCCDNGSDIVWAESANQAKVMAQSCDCCLDEPYTEIRVKRMPELDGMEDKVPYGGSAWNSDEIRTILVRDHDWACLEPEYSDCDNCCAKQWCHWMED